MNNVAHVGHSHPAVLKAVAEQYASLITNSRYLHPNITEYAKRLVATFPQPAAGSGQQPLSVMYWVNSGSEANDLALRLARAATGRRGVMCVHGAYHGHTTEVNSVSPYKYAREEQRGPRGFVRCVPQPDVHSGIFRGDAEDATVVGRYVATVDAALAAFAADEIAEAAWRSATRAGAESDVLQTFSAAAAEAKGAAEAPAADAAREWAARNTCDDGLRAGCGAFIMESIMSCGGQVLPPRDYLRNVYAAVRAAGGVCIADEVQVGFGRVGAPHFWAFELGNVLPDIVTLGKPIGGGFPVAAVITTPDIARAFSDRSEYFNTFAGSPVAGAAALAVLDVIETEQLSAAAARVGQILVSGFKSLAEKYDGVRVPHGPFIGSVRGSGLMLGLEMLDAAAGVAARVPDIEGASALKYAMLKRRVLVSSDGMHGNIIKIKPPLVFSEENARTLIEGLAACLEARALELERAAAVGRAQN